MYKADICAAAANGGKVRLADVRAIKPFATVANGGFEPRPANAAQCTNVRNPFDAHLKEINWLTLIECAILERADGENDD